MIEDSPGKSVLTGESGLLLGTDIAKLVCEYWVWQTILSRALEGLCIKLCERDARGCGAPHTHPAVGQRHDAPPLPNQQSPLPPSSLDGCPMFPVELRPYQNPAFQPSE